MASRPLLPVRMLAILAHLLRTPEGVALGRPQKVLFGFDLELDDAHAWSQVSLAGPRTNSKAVRIPRTLFVFFPDYLLGRIIIFYS